MKDFLKLVKGSVFGTEEGPVVDTSKKYKLNEVDWAKIVVNGGILAATTFVTFFAEQIQLIDFGSYTPVVILVLNTGVHALLKALKDNEVPEAK